MEPVTGKVWKFGDDINTDLIAPGRYMSSPVDEQKKHVLELKNPRFPSEVQPGDIIGGENFGCGSSREEAPAVLKACGIAAVIAESFARIFFRNAIAIGLPVVTCSGVSGAFSEGDIITLDLDAATVKGEGKTLPCDVFPPEVKAILEKGGVLPMLQEIAENQEG